MGPRCQVAANTLSYKALVPREPRLTSDSDKQFNKDKFY